jgi:hypothetical protein
MWRSRANWLAATKLRSNAVRVVETGIIGLIGGGLGALITYLGTNPALNQLNYALVLISISVLCLAFPATIALFLCFIELHSLIEKAQAPFNTEYFFNPEDRSKVFDVLTDYAKKAKHKILVVNYFSGKESPDPMNNQHDSLGQKRDDYYNLLLELSKKLDYTRVIQFDSKDQRVHQVVENQAYLKHLSNIYHIQNDPNYGFNPPHMYIIQRELPMTFTLIDSDYLLIQIERPMRDASTILRTELWGIIVIYHPDPQLIERFSSIYRSIQQQTHLWRQLESDDIPASALAHHPSRVSIRPIAQSG